MKSQIERLCLEPLLWEQEPRTLYSFYKTEAVCIKPQHAGRPSLEKTGISIATSVAALSKVCGALATVSP